MTTNGPGSTRYEPAMDGRHRQHPHPPLTLTVKDLLRTLQAVTDYVADGFNQHELSTIRLALREAADRRIEAEIKKLDRATAGARLARKLIASARAARIAARMAWRECK